MGIISKIMTPIWYLFLSKKEREVLALIVEYSKDDRERIKQLMVALDNLQAAINRLSAATDAAVTELNTPHPTDAAIQSAADLVNAQAERLETVVASLSDTTPAQPPVSGGL